MSNKRAIKNIVQKHNLNEYDEIKNNLKYWFSRPVAERLEAVEILRRQRHGNLGIIQKTVKITKFK